MSSCIICGSATTKGSSGPNIPAYCSACTTEKGWTDRITDANGLSCSFTASFTHTKSDASFTHTKSEELVNVVLGWGVWQELIQAFQAFEERWVAWQKRGGTPLTLDFLSRFLPQHHLVPISDTTISSPPPLCDGCGQAPAAFCCPAGLLPIECSRRYFACHSCHRQGHSVHRGLMGSKHREYTLSVVQKIFRAVDVDNTGALDFLEALVGMAEATRRLPTIFHQPAAQAGSRTIRAAWHKYRGPGDGISFADVQEMFQTGFRIPVPDLSAVFYKCTGGKQTAQYPQFVWVLYHVARPNSEWREKMDPDKKRQYNIAKPKISFRLKDPSATPPDFPVFHRAQASILKVLGQGTGGVVWLLQYQGYQIAAKTPSPGLPANLKDDMFAAARLQMAIKHPNVLRVLGVHESGDWPCVLLELAEGGRVTDWYTQDVDPGLQWQLALDVAQGLAALHGSSPAMIHRDVKGQNVFLTKCGTAKVADFDFVATEEAPHHTAVGIYGTPGFMAPELLAGLNYNRKVDVYSYGSLLYEVTQQAYPFSQELEDGGEEMSAEEWFDVAGSLTVKGVRPKINEERVSPKMQALITACWQRDARARPSMHEVVELLHDLKAEFVRMS